MASAPGSLTSFSNLSTSGDFISENRCFYPLVAQYTYKITKKIKKIIDNEMESNKRVDLSPLILSSI